jgi:hypothetical protein
MKIRLLLLWLLLVLVGVAPLSAQTLGTNTNIPEGTCGAGVAAADIVCANAADHTISINPNNGTLTNVPATVFLTGSAYTNGTTTFSSITGLSFPVSASRNYHAICRITWQGSANTTGPKYQFTGPATPTSVAAGMQSTVTATTFITASAVAFSSAMANSGTVTTGTNFTDTVDLAVLNGANAGTVQLQAAANGAGTLTIQPGSSCLVQ